jgi:hypothetical protein
MGKATIFALGQLDFKVIGIFQMDFIKLLCCLLVQTRQYCHAF